MTCAAGLLTAGSTSYGTFPGCARSRVGSANLLAFTTKEPLLEFGHLGFERLELALKIEGTLDSALMLGAVIISLLAQLNYFGLQSSILLPERGILLPQRTCLLLVRMLGDHHADGAILSGKSGPCPAQNVPIRIFFTCSPNIYIERKLSKKAPQNGNSTTSRFVK